jgi:hypothetical protein
VGQEVAVGFAVVKSLYYRLILIIVAWSGEQQDTESTARKVFPGT